MLIYDHQDAYHYTTVWDSQIPLSVIQLKDNISFYLFFISGNYNILEFFDFMRNTKKDSVHKRGDTLLVVPCWWDGKLGR